VTAVIMSSIGVVYLPSLKDLQKVLKYSNQEMGKFWRKMSETVIVCLVEI
jgi:hypothetical protein